MRNPTEGFRYDGDDFLDEINWIYSDVLSTDTKLVFQAYDVCFFPCLDYSTWSETEFKQAQRDLALETYGDFDGEIWLDDVRIK